MATSRHDARRGTASPSLVNRLPCSVLDLTRDGRLRFANVAARALLGLAVDDAGAPLVKLLRAPPPERQHILRRVAVLVAGRPESLSEKFAR